MELHQYKMKSSLTDLYLLASEKGLRAVLWKEQNVPLTAEPELHNTAAGKIMLQAKKQIHEYLKGDRKEFDLLLDLQGSDFQMKVWQELLKIPYGETRSYKDIAQILKSPLACRAVGTANGKNPISLIVPCHRVINSGGGLGGYAGGLSTKLTLLELERSQK